MRALTLKAVRDIGRMRGQVAAVAVMVACGIALFVSLRTMHDSLLASREAYYVRYGFADVFATLRRAPDRVAEDLAMIPGVTAARGRIVVEVVLDVPGLAEPATGRLVSAPRGEGGALNGVHLRRGRWIEAGRRDEVIVSEAFAEANRLQPGDAIGAVLHGRWQRLRIVGVGLSPEYVYEIRGAGEVFPDNRRFGVLWMNHDALATAFDQEGSFNDVVLKLAPGASEAEVIDRVDRMLERYGGLGAYGREDQISHRFLSDEIAEVQVTSVFIPAIFLVVTAFILHTLMTRTVANEREGVGVLKAFGYGDLAVAGHYVTIALAPVTVGAVAGTALGMWLAARLASLYAGYFRFPVLSARPSAGVVLTATAIAGGAALAGAWRAARAAAALPPAEAMQPPTPARFRPGPLERLGLRRLLSPASRAVIRNLERWPLKAALSTIGIALAAAIVVVGGAMFDAIDWMKDVQFQAVQREDVTVVFEEPVSSAVRYELARMPGVRRVEPFRAVDARMRSGSRAERVALLGLPRGGVLRRIVDRDLVVHAVPEDGVLLTTKLAEMLGVGPGQTVTVEVLEGARPRREVWVAGLVDEMIGLSAYMDSRALDRLLGEGPAASGAWMAVDEREREGLYARLKQMPDVAGVGVRGAALAGFEATIDESFRISIAVILGFAVVIAFGIVYNGARIALTERARELASLRVLGFTRSEVSRMLLEEQALLTGLGIPLGWLIGLGFCALIAGRFDTELFRMPIVVAPRTYAFALVVVAAAAVASGLAVRRRIDRLDLVAVLKARE